MANRYIEKTRGDQRRAQLTRSETVGEVHRNAILYAAV